MFSNIGVTSTSLPPPQMFSLGYPYPVYNTCMSSLLDDSTIRRCLISQRAYYWQWHRVFPRCNWSHFLRYWVIRNHDRILPFQRSWRPSPPAPIAELWVQIFHCWSVVCRSMLILILPIPSCRHQLGTIHSEMPTNLQERVLLLHLRRLRGKIDGWWRRW